MYQACESLRGMVNSLNPATYTPWGCSLKSKLLEFINAVASFDKRLVGFALTLKVHPLIEKLLGPAELTQLFTNCSSLHSKMGKQTLHEFNSKIREERTLVFNIETRDHISWSRNEMLKRGNPRTHDSWRHRHAVELDSFPDEITRSMIVTEHRLLVAARNSTSFGNTDGRSV